MKTKSYLRHLYILDFFQHNVSLKLENRYRLSSSVGKFLSICIIIFLLYNFFSSDMIKKKNPIVISQNFETKTRPLINLNEEEFIFAYAFTDSTNAIRLPDPTIFSLNVYQYNVVLKSNSYNIVDINTILCTEENFKRFPIEYKNLGLSKASCISTKESNKLFVKGWWDEEDISYMTFSLSKCQNETDSLVCQSSEAIDNFLKTSYFSFWIEQKNVDLTNYQEPITSKLKNFYRLMNPKEYRESNFFLKKTFIFTDDFPIYSNENILESYQHEGLEKDSNPDSFSNIIFNLCIFSGATTQIYQRNYQKLFNLLANLGGILGALTTIFSLIIKLFIEWKTSELFLNKLYFFNDQSNNFSLEKPNLISPLKTSTIIGKNKDRKKKGLILSFWQWIKTNFSKKKKNKRLTLTFWEWIKMIFKKKRNRTQKESFYLDYIRKMNKKIDLVEILKKLEEIEKIKRILFNNEQLLFFNTISKKSIYFSDRKDGKENIAKYQKNQNKLSQVQLRKIHAYFGEINKKKDDLDTLDKRLMRLIDYNYLKK